MFWDKRIYFLNCKLCKRWDYETEKIKVGRYIQRTFKNRWNTHFIIILCFDDILESEQTNNDMIDKKIRYMYIFHFIWLIYFNLISHTKTFSNILIVRHITYNIQWDNDFLWYMFFNDTQATIFSRKAGIHWWIPFVNR